MQYFAATREQITAFRDKKFRITLLRVWRGTPISQEKTVKAIYRNWTKGTTWIRLTIQKRIGAIWQNTAACRNTLKQSIILGLFFGQYRSGLSRPFFTHQTTRKIGICRTQWKHGYRSKPMVINNHHMLQSSSILWFFRAQSLQRFDKIRTGHSINSLKLYRFCNRCCLRFNEKKT